MVPKTFLVLLGLFCYGLAGEALTKSYDLECDKLAGENRTVCQCRNDVLWNTAQYMDLIIEYRNIAAEGDAATDLLLADEKKKYDNLKTLYTNATTDLHVKDAQIKAKEDLIVEYRKTIEEQKKLLNSAPLHAPALFVTASLLFGAMTIW